MRILLVMLLFFGLAERSRALEAKDLLESINIRREAAGLPVLQSDGELNSLAQEWAGTCAKKKSLSHRKDLGTIMRNRGWWVLNENIYMGSGKVDADRVLRAWMKSPGHQRNLMNGVLTQAGIGIATNPDGETYVVFNGGLRR